MISVSFQGKPFNITVIQVYDLTNSTEEAEVEQFQEDLQYLLELTPRKDVLLIIGDWKAKVGSQELPGIIETFSLGVKNEAGQKLVYLCQENALAIKKHLLPTTQEKTTQDITTPFIFLSPWSEIYNIGSPASLAFRLILETYY